MTKLEDLRIVVGVDGSIEAREALRWARRLTGVLGGEVVVVHALGLLETLHGELVIAHRKRAEIEQVLEWEWCGPLRAGGIELRTVVREGHPVEVLLAEADEVQADLLVVGARGGGSSPAFDLGRTSLHNLQAAALPVLVVPDRRSSASHLGLRRILVGVDVDRDDGRSCEAAVEMACGLASAFEAWVTVVQAVDSLASSQPQDLEEGIAAQLRPRLARCGVPTHVAVRRGRPDEVVRSMASVIDADLVVTGCRGPRQDAGLVAGSVSRHIVQAIHRPTLVVPEVRSSRGLPGPASTLASA